MTGRGRLVAAGPQVRLPVHAAGGAERAAGSLAGPVRTCLGCRRRDQRSVLLRVVRVDRGDEIVAVVDEGRSLPGRGAWVHPHLQCLELAERRRAFPRALRTGSLDTTPVRRHLEGTTGSTVDPAAHVVIDKEAGWKPMGPR